MGGVHWLAEAGGRLVGHASVVPRILEADGRPIRDGLRGGRRRPPDRSSGAAWARG